MPQQSLNEAERYDSYEAYFNAARALASQYSGLGISNVFNAWSRAAGAPDPGHRGEGDSPTRRSAAPEEGEQIAAAPAEPRNDNAGEIPGAETEARAQTAEAGIP